MLCPPTMRPASPAESEISVGGAPSPLPQPSSGQQQQQHNRTAMELLQQQQHILMHHQAVAAAAAARAAVGNIPEEYFQPLKRLRMSEDASELSPKERSPSPVQTQYNSTNANSNSSATATTKSAQKSFSIADILGHDAKRDDVSAPPSSRLSASASGLLQPRTEPLDNITHPAAVMLLPASPHVVRPWDHLLGPMPHVRPFIPSALLHYEQRLALDYHRQLQEHFNAQAQLLRHMNGMDIIPSESGSERSSSAASDCCSPEINRSSASDGGHLSHSAQQERSQERSGNISGNGSAGSSVSSAGDRDRNASGSGDKTKTPNGTPLDALFQMTTKDFDDSEGKSAII